MNPILLPTPVNKAAQPDEQVEVISKPYIPSPVPCPSIFTYISFEVLNSNGLKENTTDYSIEKEIIGGHIQTNVCRHIYTEESLARQRAEQVVKDHLNLNITYKLWTGESPIWEYRNVPYTNFLSTEDLYTANRTYDKVFFGPDMTKDYKIKI